MPRLGNTRKFHTLVQCALRGGGLAAKPGRAHGMRGRAVRSAGNQRRQYSPCEVPQPPAQIIQLMRLEHPDPLLYRDGCGAVARTAIDASQWMGLQPALAEVMDVLTQGNHHWARTELRAISQLDWRTC